MTVPILLPVIAETDIDLLWFGVFISMLCTVGTISPPVGLSVYAVSGATGVPSGPVFRYALWIALVTTAIVAVVMILFPPPSSWRRWGWWLLNAGSSSSRTGSVSTPASL